MKRFFTLDDESVINVEQIVFIRRFEKDAPARTRLGKEAVVTLTSFGFEGHHSDFVHLNLGEFARLVVFIGKEYGQ